MKPVAIICLTILSCLVISSFCEAVVIKIAYSADMAAVVQPPAPDAEPIPVPGAKIIQLAAGALILGVGIWLIMGRRRIVGHEH